MLVDPIKGHTVGGFEVLTEHGLIKEVSDKPISAGKARIVDLKGKSLMPGLIDLHAHVVAVDLNVARMARMPNVLVTLKSVPLLEGMLRRGFTTVRDAGGAGFAHKQAVDAGLCKGPRLYVSGRALSQTGGHGDMRSRSDFIEDDLPCPTCARVGALSRIADGVDGVRKAAREELQMGADQIKIMASGGVASPTDPIGAVGFCEDEIRAIVGEANSRGTYVMAHAYTPAAIQRAIRCGVRTIEHGNLVDEETALLMRQMGVFAIPTLATYDALASEGESLGLPSESVQKVERVRQAGLRSLEIFKKAGVKMGFGSDLLGDSQRLQSNEFRLRSEVLTAAEILESATVTAAEVIGMGGRLGCIQAGAFADLLVVDGDPLKDISCLLGQGERILLVMKGGEIQFDRLSM
ncbi:amidohydrolase family protein [Variovorax rhizosphaerae]|uniref:Amidohydrolase family protein n=2 Tax=Variovorax rhizosphaerae TaxID=1836200 RepID=A0ABU8WT37_9BURK